MTTYIAIIILALLAIGLFLKIFKVPSKTQMFLVIIAVVILLILTFAIKMISFSLIMLLILYLLIGKYRQM